MYVLTPSFICVCLYTRVSVDKLSILETEDILQAVLQMDPNRYSMFSKTQTPLGPHKEHKGETSD